MRKIIQKERDGGGGVGERTEVANHNTVEYRQTKSLMVRNYYAGQHYDALVGSEHEQPGGSVTRMIHMFPSGVSEMCSLAVACGVTEFEKASRNGVDTLAASMSSMRHAAQRGVGIDFCASRYAKGPELERGNSPSGAPAIAKNVGDRSGEEKVPLNEYEKAVAYLEVEELEACRTLEGRARAAARAFIAVEIERGNSPSGAPAIAKKVGDRSGEEKVPLHEYLAAACAQGMRQEVVPKAAAPVSAHSLAQTPGDGPDCNHMWMQEYLQKCQAGLSADLQSVQSSTASAGEMSQEAKDLIQSLKLAAQLTKEDLKKVQDINTMPAFDPDTTAGLGHNPSFFNSLATRRSGICLPLLLLFFSRRLDPAAERL